MKLKLQDVGEEVARVGHAARHVILRAGIEVRLSARHRRRDALVFLAQFPPGGVVLIGRHFAREDLPAPLIDHEAEGQEGDLLKRPFHQQSQVARGIRHGLDQTDLLQVIGRDGKLDRVADRFVEAVVGAIAEEEGLLVIGALIVVVAELVIDGEEILAGRLDAHLDAQIIDVVDVPRRGVTHDIAIAGFGEERALEEGGGQGFEAERNVHRLAEPHHVRRRGFARLQDLRQVITGIGIRRGQHRIEVVPRLGPHVAQQVRRDRTVRGDSVTVFLAKLVARVGVQREVERLDLLPQAVDFLGEVVGRHVVLRTPHRAGVGEAELFRALVREIDVAHEVRLDGRGRFRGHGMPSLPGFEQLGGIATLGDGLRQLLQVLASIRLGAVFALAVVALHARHQLREFGGVFRVGRRGDRQPRLEDLHLAGLIGGQIDAVIAGRFLGELNSGLDLAFVGGGGEGLGIGRDVGRLDPTGLACRVRQREQFFLGPFEELPGAFGGRLGAVASTTATHQHEKRERPQPVRLHNPQLYGGLRQ